MRRTGWALLLVGMTIAVAASLVPVGDASAGLNQIDVSCGPALGAVMRWTGPGSDHAPDPTIRTGSDTGYSAPAWCQLQGWIWLWPAVPLALTLASCGAVLLVVGAFRRSKTLGVQPGLTV